LHGFGTRVDGQRIDANERRVGVVLNYVGVVRVWNGQMQLRFRYGEVVLILEEIHNRLALV
jgi:hypothetical protein